MVVKKLSLHLVLLLSLGYTSGYGQKSVNISVVRKQESIKSDSSDRTFLFSWDEVVLKDKEVTKLINSEIRVLLSIYKEIPWDAEEYSPECKIVYAKNNLISYTLTSYTYFSGAPHGYRLFQTRNFSAFTGQQINFRAFIKDDKIAKLDSVILDMLEKRLTSSDLEHYKQQLPNLYFELSDKGIRIDFIGENYATSVVDIHMDFKQLEQFVNKRGLLKGFYAH